MNRRTVLVAGAATVLAVACKKQEEKKEDDVTPSEDLMREHGVLRRILLVWQEASRRSDQTGAQTITDGARIVKKFVHDYHERLEEDHLFPAFERAGKHAPLVAELRKQHEAGRKLTDRILAGGDVAAVAAAVLSFTRMYEPHAAREDTVLFPSLHEVLSAKQLDELGEKFEDEEHQKFPKGFEGVVEEVAALEKRLGIDDLAKFTPPG